MFLDLSFTTKQAKITGVEYIQSHGQQDQAARKS